MAILAVVVVADEDRLAPTTSTAAWRLSTARHRPRWLRRSGARCSVRHVAPSRLAIGLERCTARHVLVAEGREVALIPRYLHRPTP